MFAINTWSITKEEINNLLCASSLSFFSGSKELWIYTKVKKLYIACTSDPYIFWKI